MIHGAFNAMYSSLNRKFVTVLLFHNEEQLQEQYLWGYIFGFNAALKSEIKPNLDT